MAPGFLQYLFERLELASQYREEIQADLICIFRQPRSWKR
jgi:hypothetical protein